jgi:ribonuclease HI
MIIGSTSLSGNLTKHVFYSSMSEFTILKNFKVKVHPPKAPVIKEVIWHPPILNWTKCNIDGAATSTTSSCGGIFRNHLADFIGCFAERLTLCSAFFAEVSGALRALELASQNNWTNLWIETDSALLVLAFKSSSMIPWSLRNRWNNALLKSKNMNLLVTHIYREGNVCADRLANIGLNLVNFTFWNSLPIALCSNFNRDKLGLPSYRFTSF